MPQLISMEDAPPRPIALALKPEDLPPELMAFNHFLLWDWTLRTNKQGEKIWTKPPFRVVGTGLAKSTDSDGWGSFRDALAAARVRKMAGIGFALSADDPFCFGDIDDCVDEHGTIADWAKPIVDRFKASYQEISPSGTGIKILVIGKLPGDEHRWRVGKDPRSYVEWFDSAKYTTLTGHRVAGAGRGIVDAQNDLNALYRECFPPKVERPTNGSTPPPSPSQDDDDARLAKARSSRQGPDFMRLFDAGDIAGYANDHSVADLALCGMLAFWFGPDEARIDRMFRRSKLMRDKWNDREDYRKATIGEALKGRSEFYTPRPARHLTIVSNAPTEELEQPPSPPPQWPELDEAALAGVAGDVVYALAPHTEADDVATLMTFLVFFGCACNRGPFMHVGDDRHGTNLFAVLVGNTSKARKGTSQAGPKRLLRLADPNFVDQRFIEGLSTGEGLIWQIRDAVIKIDKKGNEIVEVNAVDDKRLVCVEEEFAQLLNVSERPGNTLSPIVRKAWDARGTMATTTRNSPAKATNPHVSIMGHVTIDELKRTLTDTAVANGLGNRFLWALVRRSKILPEPGRIDEHEAATLGRLIHSRLQFARAAGEITRDAEAKALWGEVYPELSAGKPGLSGALTARSEAQVLRLSLLYALLDQSKTIGTRHLESALALWRYCEASVKHVFGDLTGDPVADRILAALRANFEPLSQTEISDLFGRNVPAAQLGRAFEVLLKGGLVQSRQAMGETGRLRLVWFPAK